MAYNIPTNVFQRPKVVTKPVVTKPVVTKQTYGSTTPTQPTTTTAPTYGAVTPTVPQNTTQQNQYKEDIASLIRESANGGKQDLAQLPTNTNVGIKTNIPLNRNIGTSALSITPEVRFDKELKKQTRGLTTGPTTLNPTTDIYGAENTAVGSALANTNVNDLVNQVEVSPLSVLENEIEKQQNTTRADRINFNDLKPNDDPADTTTTDTTTTDSTSGPTSEIDKLYQDMLKANESAWAGQEQLGQSNLAALQRKAAAMQGSMGRSVAGGFAGAMGGAYGQGMEALQKAKVAHDQGTRDLMMKQAIQKQQASQFGTQMGMETQKIAAQRAQAAAMMLSQITDPNERAQAQLDMLMANASPELRQQAYEYQSNSNSGGDPAVIARFLMNNGVTY